MEWGSTTWFYSPNKDEGVRRYALWSHSIDKVDVYYFKQLAIFITQYSRVGTTNLPNFSAQVRTVPRTNVLTFVAGYGSFHLIK